MKKNLQLHAEAMKLRRQLGYGTTEPIDIVSLLIARDDYTIVRLPMSDRISGMCIVDNESKIIAINSMMSQGRQRFTMSHELYHIEIENVKGGIVCKKEEGSRQDSEREADCFASYFLLPADALGWFVDEFGIDEWEITDVVRLSQTFRMSFQAVLYRLHLEGMLDDIRYRKFWDKDILKLAAEMGQDMSLYMKTPVEEMEKSYGEYRRLLEHAKGEEKISDSLYRQFATEGFCNEKWEKLTKEAVVYD